MPTQAWSERFLETTRGRIVVLLRRGTSTVNELADALELTDNAVRGHLAVLERDGLIERAGVRRGVGKPAHVYRLTVEGGLALSRAHAPVLMSLLEALGERLSKEQLDGVLDAAGRRAAPSSPTASSSPEGENGAANIRERAEEAVRLIDALGGDAYIDRRNGTLTIRGHGCVLGDLNEQQPLTCRMLQSLLSEMLGQPVREICERNGNPRCAFETEVPTDM